MTIVVIAKILWEREKTMRHFITHSCVENFTSEQAVKRGLSYLNHYLPEWRTLIDLEALYDEPRRKSVYAQLHTVLETRGLLPQFDYENYRYGHAHYVDRDGRRYHSTMDWAVNHGLLSWGNEHVSYDLEQQLCWYAAASGQRWELTKKDNGDAVSYVEGMTATPRDVRHYQVSMEEISSHLHEFLVKIGASVDLIGSVCVVTLPKEVIFRYDQWKYGGERLVWLMPDGTVICKGHTRGIFIMEDKKSRGKYGTDDTWLEIFFPDHYQEYKNR